MRGITIGYVDNSRSTLTAAISAALQCQNIQIIYDEKEYFESLDKNENMFEVPNIMAKPKQHEQYGWYRKFDKRKFR